MTTSKCGRNVEKIYYIQDWTFGWDLKAHKKGKKREKKKRKAFYIMRFFFLGIMVDLHEKRSKLDTYKSLNIIALAHT